MILRDDRRAAALARIADHMLQHGLALSSLRALARTAGTSDRMLLYYFADKDEIIVAALGEITVGFASVLTSALEGRGKRRPDVLLSDLAAVMRSGAARPYLRLWLELSVLAARGEEPYRSVAGRMADGFVAMVAHALDIDEAARHETAARLVATMDGVLLLDCVGRESLGTAALTSS
jgi:AcrR family transcriptional regulator